MRTSTLMRSQIANLRAIADADSTDDVDRAFLHEIIEGMEEKVGSLAIDLDVDLLPHQSDSLLGTGEDESVSAVDELIALCEQVGNTESAQVALRLKERLLARKRRVIFDEEEV
jgi:hypothetical protein